jgi:DNA-binding ferritin-like protein
METNLLRFIQILEGFKIKFKELHWNADSQHLHNLADEIYESLNQFQDEFAEEVFANYKKFESNSFKPIYGKTKLFIETLDKLTEFISIIKRKLVSHNDNSDIDNSGLIGLCDNYLHVFRKFQYLAKNF